MHFRLERGHILHSMPPLCGAYQRVLRSSCCVALHGVILMSRQERSLPLHVLSRGGKINVTRDTVRESERTRVHPRRHGLNIEPNLEDIAVLDDVILAFEAEAARVLHALHTLELHKIIVRHHLGADEPAGQV